jgi:hypothetical protein
MAIKDKLLVLSCLPLPLVLVHLIGDYAFTRIEDRTRRQKSDLISRINARIMNTYLITSQHMKMTHTFLWIEDDHKMRQFWFLHCRKCGEYIGVENKLTPLLDAIMCDCVN